MMAKRTTQSGFSLIEMMVAATIAMLGTLVMFQTMSSGERYKRVTTSGNDSQQGAMIAFDQLSFMVRNAGAGLVQTPGSFNCLLQAWDGGARIYPSGAAMPAPFGAVDGQLRLAPLQALDGGANNPDILVVMRGESSSGNIADTAGRAANAGNSLGTVNTVGLRPNDLLLMTRFQPDALGNPRSADCFLTQSNPTAGELDGATGYIVVNPFRVTGARFSAPAASMPPASDRYSVSTLGASPSILLIGVRRSAGRSDLVMYDALNRGNITVLAENVVDFQVAYGVDTTIRNPRTIGIDVDYFGDGLVENWVNPTGDWSWNNLRSTVGAGSQGWTGAERQRRIKAVRIGLITVDGVDERTAVDRASNNLTLFTSLGSAIEVTRSIGSTNFPATSRYRTFEMSLPIRNLTSGLSPIQEDLIIP
jgi:type IV pilus assembly protein PilW